jgi:hypothetical protein
MSSMMTRAILCLGLSVAFGCAHLAPGEKPAPAAAPASEKIARAAIASPVKPKVASLPLVPASALLIGNSFFYYNNSLHNQLGRLVRAAEPRIVPGFRSTSVTISGSGIDWHDVESYFRPNAIGSYSFDSKNNVVFNKLDKLFDVAIVMDCSQCPIHPKLKPVFHEFAKKDVDIIRKHRAVPVFFMSWAYEDKPGMTAQLAEQYTIAGNANDALVIPAGLAFARALHQRPALRLYADDKRHPSPEGTYLAACTTFASLYKRSPVGLKYTAGLDPAMAGFLQTVAWETVTEYYGR